MPKALDATQETAPDVTAVSPPSIAGFVPAQTWRWVTCDGVGLWRKLAPAPGAEPFRAEIADDLTFDEVAAIPMQTGTTYQLLWPHLVGRVKSWNVVGRNVETGQYEPVPPPLEGGLDSFRAAPKLVTEWLANCLKYGHVGFADADLPKESGQQSDTGDGSDATG